MDTLGRFDYQDLYDEVVLAAPSHLTSHFVELGVAFGRSAIYLATKIAESGKPIRLHAIDSWKMSYLYSRPRYLRALADKHGGMRQAFEWFAVQAGVRSQIAVIEQDIILAARNYEPSSVDFVFLIACQTEQGTRGAITAWLPRLKPGGVFAGSEFVDGWSGVAKAVKAVLPGASRRGSCFFYRSPLVA